jgi:hypothetical protein
MQQTHFTASRPIRIWKIAAVQLCALLLSTATLSIPTPRDSATPASPPPLHCSRTGTPPPVSAASPPRPPPSSPPDASSSGNPVALPAPPPRTWRGLPPPNYSVGRCGAHVRLRTPPRCPLRRFTPLPPSLPPPDLRPWQNGSTASFILTFKCSLECPHDSHASALLPLPANPCPPSTGWLYKVATSTSQFSLQKLFPDLLPFTVCSPHASYIFSGC